MLIFALMCFFTYLIDCGGKVGVLKWVGIFCERSILSDICFVFVSGIAKENPCSRPELNRKYGLVLFGLSVFY